MSKKNYEVQWTPDITITAGNGSVSIDTPMGNGISISNLVPIVPRCSCCQFCPFTDGAIYTSFPAQVKCTLTNEFHFCGDTHCDVKEKVIPIEWIKEYVDKYSLLGIISKEYEVLYAMLEDWEEENEKCKKTV